MKEFKLVSLSWSKNVQRLKEFFEKVQIEFLNYCPLYKKTKNKNVYKDDKLEENSKCKVKR